MRFRQMYTCRTTTTESYESNALVGVQRVNVLQCGNFLDGLHRILELISVVPSSTGTVFVQLYRVDCTVAYSAVKVTETVIAGNPCYDTVPRKVQCAE